jgi:tetratricopeptide (TPR) repeat protein
MSLTLSYLEKTMSRTAVLLLLCAPLVFADNQEKNEKKALEHQAQAFVKEAKDLEKSGKLLEARARYASSQAFAETKDAAEAIKRIDGEIQKRVRAAVQQAHKLYDQAKYPAAAQTLEAAAKLGASGSVLSYDLALCKRHMGDSAAAVAHLDQAAESTGDPKRKLKIKQLRTAMITDEQPAALKNDERDRMNKVNQLMDTVGFETSVEDRPATVTLAAASPNGEAPVVPAALRSGVSPVAVTGNKPGLRSVSLCQSLEGLKTAATASVTFNLANCAEDTGRTAEAAQLLGRYLEAAPKATDAERTRLRIERLNALAGLQDRKGEQVRSLFSSASRYLEERKYDLALADYQRAVAVAPEFAPGVWRLALMYEAQGRIEQARENFNLYSRLETTPAGRQEAQLHLETLDAKRDQYDDEVGQASAILADLFNRAMNLTFNGLEDRASQYKQRAKERARMYAKQKLRVVGGFTVPFGYAQQQLADAGDHLANALVLFPQGAEANQLMGLVLLQANDGRSSMRSFDAVASQNLPVAFYAQLRERNSDRSVKCELTRDGLRMIYLSSYDKKGKPVPPAKPAGEDGLGDIAIDPATERAQDFDARTIKPVDIKSIETKSGSVVLKLAKEQLMLSPIYLPAPPPADGPPARRFTNNYTRLFVRYPGLEEAKLGAEGLTAMEKIRLGFDIANASFNIATSLNPFGAIGALTSFISITRELNAVSKSLHVDFAGWAKTIEDQQELQAGNAFKAIPTEALNLAFVEEIK